MTLEEMTVYLRDLAERLRHIPVAYGTDDGDISTLLEIANQLEKPTQS